MYRATVRSAALELFWFQWTCLQPLLVWWDLWLCGCHDGNWCASGCSGQCAKHVCRSMLGRGTVRSAALELFGYQWACLQPLMVWWDLSLVGCHGGQSRAHRRRRPVPEQNCLFIFTGAIRGAAPVVFLVQL